MIPNSFRFFKFIPLQLLQPSLVLVITLTSARVPALVVLRLLVLGAHLQEQVSLVDFFGELLRQLAVGVVLLIYSIKIP